MGFSGKAQLQGCNKRRFKVVTSAKFTDEAGEPLSFRIRNLFDDEKAAFESNTLSDRGYDKKAVKAQRRKLLVACLVDGDGNQLFSEADLDWLREIDGGVTTWLYAECREHCGFDVEAIETLSKKSDAIGDGGSPSGSRSRSDVKTQT